MGPRVSWRLPGFPGIRWIQGDDLASPLFFLLGLWWGFEVRVSFIPDPATRFFYYVLLSGLGLLAYFRPGTAPWVALCECSVNLLLIMLWILMPIYSLAEAGIGQGPVGVPYTPTQVLVNGLLAGSFFLLGFYKAQSKILKRLPWMSSEMRRGPGTDQGSRGS